MASFDARRLVAAIAVFGFAFSLRAIPAPLVDRPEGIDYPSWADELYHLRRIEFTAEHFPGVLTHDSYVNYPDGARLIWPPGFDFALGAIARVLADRQEPDGVARVVIWAPPLLGAATAVLLLWALSVHLSLVAGVAAGLWVAVLPGSYFQSQVGMIDHHAAAALVSAWMATAAWVLFRAGPSVGRGVVLGAALGLGPLVWTGALFQAQLVQSVVIAWVLLTDDRDEAGARARVVALAHAVAGVMLIPAALGEPFPIYGAWSPMVLTRIQPTWFLGGAAVLAASTFAWRVSPFGATLLGRIGVAGAVGALLAGLAWFGLPGLADGVGMASGVFAAEGEMISTIAESQPLLYPRGVLDFGVATVRLSVLMLIFPALWLTAAVVAFRRQAGPGAALVLVLSGAWALAAYAQIRFVNSFTVAWALFVGLAVELARPTLARFWQGGGAVRQATLATAAIALGWVVTAPFVFNYRVHLAEARAGERRLPAAAAMQKAGIRAARWLRDATPETTGYEDGAAQPEYGVLAPWNLGHALRAVAHRAPVQDNFGPYTNPQAFSDADAYYAGRDEAEAVALLERRGVRYVFADRLGAGRTRPYAPGTMTHRLSTLLGSGLRARNPGTGRTRTIPALSRHRLVHLEGVDPAYGEATANYRIAIFEVVPGAEIHGRGTPGEEVRVTLDLSVAGRALTWRAWADVGEDRTWALRAPYATDNPTSEGVRTRGPYRIAAGDQSTEVHVTESTVRTGEHVEAPPLD